jgi:TetR/AcrR family transcriptional regulator, regulator of cefoperazone and chloramphenicol sensitivity
MFCINLKPSRGEETRAKLIQAGVVLFAQRGFDGVSARALTKAAGTTLSSMTYHFETMEALYLAVIKKMVSQMDQRLAPAMLQLQTALRAKHISPQVALDRMTDHLVQEIVCNKDGPEWPMLLIREHLTQGPAYELIYNDVMLRIHDFLSQLFAMIRGGKANDPDIELAAFAHLGTIIFFRIGSQTIKRRMAWAAIDETTRPAIAKAVSFKI